jgi:hypothetical protein
MVPVASRAEQSRAGEKEITHIHIYIHAAEHIQMYYMKNNNINIHHNNHEQRHTHSKISIKNRGPVQRVEPHGIPPPALLPRCSAVHLLHCLLAGRHQTSETEAAGRERERDRDVRCVCERERERERSTQAEREREKQRDRERNILRRGLLAKPLCISRELARSLALLSLTHSPAGGAQVVEDDGLGGQVHVQLVVPGAAHTQTQSHTDRQTHRHETHAGSSQILPALLLSDSVTQRLRE